MSHVSRWSLKVEVNCLIYVRFKKSWFTRRPSKIITWARTTWCPWATQSVALPSRASIRRLASIHYCHRDIQNTISICNSLNLCPTLLSSFLSKLRTTTAFKISKLFSDSIPQWLLLGASRSSARNFSKSAGMVETEGQGLAHPKAEIAHGLVDFIHFSFILIRCCIAGKMLMVVA